MCFLHRIVAAATEFARLHHEISILKRNVSRYVSHVDHWLDIATSFHGDTELRYLGLCQSKEYLIKKPDTHSVTMRGGLVILDRVS